MKTRVRSVVSTVLRVCVRLLSKIRVGRILLERFTTAVGELTVRVHHAGCDLDFFTPSSITRFRADTFSSKEPETLEWIDEISRGSVLWDIGANVGSYSCYAAKARTCRVYAFEPSVFNLELLARNIALNRLTDRITVVPLPLTEALGESTLNMMTTEPGGAMSSFGVDHGHDGKPIEAIFQVRTIGFSMQDAVTSLGIPQPDYIKMDVDGIEHLILGGGADVLQNVRSVLVEINDDFERQAVMAVQHLSAAGLILNDKRRAAMFDNTAYAPSYNQIWRRSNGVD